MLKIIVMQAFLFVVLFVVGGIVLLFLITFLVGFILAASTSSEKKLKEWARGVINTELSEKERYALREIWLSFKSKDTTRAGEVLAELKPDEIAHLKGICAPNFRPKVFSAGAFGDNLSWQVWFDRAKEIGFGNDEAHIIAGIALNGYEVVVE